jgi:hypothetical protein
VKSFDHSYFYEMPISHGLDSSMRLLAEFKGRAGLHTRQSPEVLETLRRATMMQSVESPNRIEGVTMAAVARVRNGKGWSADIINMPPRRVVASLMCQPASTQCIGRRIEAQKGRWNG